MNDKLRECPFCGKPATKQSDFMTEYTGRDITCISSLCRINGLFFTKEEWNTRHQPKHETVSPIDLPTRWDNSITDLSDRLKNREPKHEIVQQWEERTGETYPEDGPVYPADMFGGKPCYKDCRSYTDAKKQKWNIIIVANHHGKPEEIK